MTKVHLHIGRHKTGTSSIQRFLYKNTKFLEKYGFDYHVDLVDRGFGHHTFAEKISPRKIASKEPQLEDAHQFYRRLTSSLTQGRHHIISSEAFQNCNPNMVSNVFKGFDINAFCYIRNELDYLASAYAQKIHATLYTGSIEDFSRNFDINYFEFLESWSQVFKLKVRVFEKKQLHKEDVVKDFLFNSLGISNLDNINTSLDANPSINDKYVALKLHLNRNYTWRNSDNNKLYESLTKSSLSDNEGLTYRIPKKIKEQKIKNLKKNQSKWSRKYFEVNEVFAYDSVKTSIQYQLSKNEIDTFIKEIKSSIQLTRIVN